MESLIDDHSSPEIALAPLCEIIGLQFLAREMVLRHSFLQDVFHHAAKVITME
jgi:hypothetical protein